MTLMPSGMWQGAEEVRGRKWKETLEIHGDWTREAVVSVAVREGGIRIAEVLRHLPEISYNAAAQAILYGAWGQIYTIDK